MGFWAPAEFWKKQENTGAAVPAADGYDGWLDTTRSCAMP
jgi:hypothetical protein